MQKKDKIFIAGAHGMVGSALTRKLHREGYHNLVLPTRHEVDLTEQLSVRNFLQTTKPKVVVIAAARVGGIKANQSYPAEFLYENLMIESHLIHESYKAGVKRLLFLGSSCIYPRLAPQPIREEALLSGPLESTNEAYAVAKIAGLKMTYHYAQQYGVRYIAAMPTNLYGPKDNYAGENAHVIPALLERFHTMKMRGEKSVTIWGTGSVQREFLYVDDLAEALFFLLLHYEEPLHINVGTEEEVTIAQLASLIQEVVGFQGDIVFDPSKMEGTPRKKSDVSRLYALGWRPKIQLKEGLQLAYEDFLKRKACVSNAFPAFSQSC